MAEPSRLVLAPLRKAMAFYKALRTEGWKSVAYNTWKMGEFRFGELKGVDQFGNKYYENLDSYFLRDRFVVYASGTKWDGSQVPPEWHVWMHRQKDVTPEQNPISDPIYRSPHIFNPTGTQSIYRPPGHAFNPQSQSPLALAFTKKHESWMPNVTALNPVTGRPVVPKQLAF